MIYTASSYYKSPDPCQAFKRQTWSLWFALISASFTFPTHSPSITACCIDSPDTYLKLVNTMPSPTEFGHFTATAAFQNLIQQTCFMTAPNKHPLKSFSLIGLGFFCLFGQSHDSSASQYFSWCGYHRPGSPGFLSAMGKTR